MKKIIILNILALISLILPLSGQDKIRVVTTLTTYADITRQIGGDKVEVSAIVQGDQDAHFVAPKPSFAVLLSKAELFVETGLDLELWVPVLLDKAGNPGIRGGQPGYVAAADGVKLLEVPAAADRSQGDVHIYGNPHITTSPLNIKIVARNITIGLNKVSPENSDFFEQNLKDYNQTIDEKLFGIELLQILGAETLTELAQSGTLVEFLENQSFRERPLIEYLDGWIKQMLPWRGTKIVTYHRNWVYFEQLFGLEIIGNVEPKPGIPPSPKHVEQLISRIKQNKVKIVLAANYFDQRKIRDIAERINGDAVVVPLSVGGNSQVSSYIHLVDYWVGSLNSALVNFSNR
jgi:ABC-type Zn uptake system ZnuABC Zn-binding protein ZnuA